MKSKKTLRKLPSSRDGLIKWLAEFSDRPLMDRPVQPGFAFCWEADGLVTDVEHIPLNECETSGLSKAEKEEMLARWKTLSKTEKADLAEEGADWLRRGFSDHLADGAPMDESTSQSESGEDLNLNFEWFSDDCLTLTQFYGREMGRSDLFETCPQFKDWSTKELKTLCQYLTRITNYVNEDLAKPTGLAREMLDSWEDFVETMLVKHPTANEKALEILGKMTVRTWKKDRDLLLKLLSESDSASPPRVE